MGLMEKSVVVAGIKVYYTDTGVDGEAGLAPAPGAGAGAEPGADAGASSGADARAYTGAGAPAGRQILFLLHGWGASKETFAPVVTALGHRYRLIAPDWPGCGRTAEPDRPWDVAAYVDFFTAFVAALGLENQRFSAAGHSHGGRVLIKWAAGRPAGLERLTLIDSAGLRPRRGPAWYAKVYSYKAAKLLTRLPGLGACLAPWAAARMARAGSEDYRQASPLMRRTMTLLLAEDLSSCLPRITAPTLLFWGREDRDTPLAFGRRMAELIPDAGLVELAPAGHYSYLDQLPLFLRTLTYFMEAPGA